MTSDNACLLQRLGLDTSKLALCQPDSGEQALEVVDQSVRSSAVDIICVDSVAALVPRAEIEGEMGAHQGQHRLCTVWCAYAAAHGSHNVQTSLSCLWRPTKVTDYHSPVLGLMCVS